MTGCSRFVSPRLVSAYDRLLRGSAAAKSLSGSGSLRHRGRHDHSDRLGGFSDLGPAKLEFAFDGPWSDRFPDSMPTLLILVVPFEFPQQEHTMLRPAPRTSVFLSRVPLAGFRLP